MWVIGIVILLFLRRWGGDGRRGGVAMGCGVCGMGGRICDIAVSAASCATVPLGVAAAETGLAGPSQNGTAPIYNLWTAELKTHATAYYYVFVFWGWNDRNGVPNRPHLRLNWSTPLLSSRPDRIPFATVLPRTRCRRLGLGL